MDLLLGCGLMQKTKDIQHEDIYSKSVQRCGLMQKTKDIQRCNIWAQLGWSCGLMQKTKDIQLDNKITDARHVVV